MNTIEILNKLHDFVSKPILLIAFVVLVLSFAVSSLVLVYHWRRYAIDKAAIVTAQSIFFLGGLLILLIGLVSIILY